jgi:GNAT superfamily N-acetyltransferase
MIRELASYEKALDAVEATEETLLSTLSFPSNPSNGYAKTLLLFPPSSVPVRGKALPLVPSDESDSQTGKPAGMALYFTNYSTWRAAPGVYLEDLFVRPEYRKRGYGKLLLQELAKETRRIGGRRLEWSVLKWNQPSIDFYLSKVVGATRMEEWVGMRVDGEALEELAKQGPE